jgi:hypothetical protein
MTTSAELLSLAVRRAAFASHTPPYLKDPIESEHYRKLCFSFLHACFFGANSRTIQHWADEMYRVRAEVMGHEPSERLP